MTPAQTDVRKGEAGVIRVWAIGRPMAEAEAIGADAQRLAGLLGIDGIAPSGAEVIDTRRLADIGLSGYLAEGLGVAAGDVRPHAARLDAARGPVLILRSVALRGEAAKLVPDADLTPLGTFVEAAAKPMTPRFSTGSGEAPAAAGEAASSGPEEPAGATPRWIPIAALAVAVVLILILVL